MKSKPRLNLSTFPQLCDYVRANTQETLLKNAFEFYLKQNNISIAINDLKRRKLLYNYFLENNYVGKFKSQVEGGAKIADSIADAKEHLEEYEKLYSILSDDLSRKTLYHLFYYYLFLNQKQIQMAFSGSDQYYLTSLLPKREHQVMVDCGACDGETVAEFIKIYGEYDKIYAYEPVPDNYHKVVERLTSYENITVFNRGVSNEPGEMRFTSHLPSSANRLHPLGDTVVKVSTIDSDIPEKITFLKMDIESAEPNALVGAKRHIIEDKPDLAICVYHTITDIWNIPKIIYNMNPDQKFYLRHHREDKPEETVFYACPNQG